MITEKKHYDLEERTLQFAMDVRDFIKILPKTMINFEYGKQVIRSSGSVGANYIEANEALSPKDFLMRIKICRKEAKETIFWLRLVDTNDNIDLEQVRGKLLQEAKELLLIVVSIMNKRNNTN